MVPFRVRRATVAKNEDYNYSVFNGHKTMIEKKGAKLTKAET